MTLIRSPLANPFAIVDPRPPRLGRPLLVLILLLAWPLSAQAEETDYLPDNLAWNGLSQFADLASEPSTRLVLVQELDWSAIPAGAGVFIIYPRVPLDPQPLLRLIHSGGRVLIADDFGPSLGLFQALGITRVNHQAIDALQTIDQNPRLPWATWIAPTHPLTNGVKALATNHPAFFRSQLPTLAGFGDGKQQLLIAGKLGQGRYVALADPSILINGMLRYRANRLFATNLLEFLTPRGPTKRYLLTGYFRVKPIRPSPNTDQPKPHPAQTFLSEYGDFLNRINDFAPTDRTWQALTLIACALLLLSLIVILPLPRSDLLGHWLRPGQVLDRQSRPRSQDHGSDTSNRRSVQAAAALHDELEAVLSATLRTSGPLLTLDPGWAASQLSQRAGAEAGRLCFRLLTDLQRLPPDHEQMPLSPNAAVSRRKLQKMVQQSQRLLKLLGKDALPGVS